MTAARPLDERVRRNRRWFKLLLTRALLAEKLHRDDEATMWAQRAATWAWRNHSGFHRSPELDALVDRIGRRLPLPNALNRPGVVHIVSETPATGGHTRWLEQWIRADTDRRHHIVITRGGPPAERLTKLGATIASPPVGRTLRAHVQTLRSVAIMPELVVMWHTPDDIAATMTLAFDLARPASIRPPIAIANHADHCFWVAPLEPTSLVEFRAAGAELSRARRGADMRRQVLMPLPVEPPPVEPPPAVDRAAARHQLGLAPSDVAIVTMGAPYKYAGPRPTLFETMGPILDEHPQVRLYAIGPGAQPDAHERLTALPLTPDPSVYQAAADIYVDSYPFGGVTAIIESALRGTPCLSMSAAGRPPILSDGGPGFETVRYVDSGGELVDLVKRLIVDPEERAQIGNEQRAAFDDRHDPKHTLAAIRQVNVLASPRGDALSSPAAPADVEPLDEQLLALFDGAGQTYGRRASLKL